MGTALQNAPECMSGLRIFPSSHTEYTRWSDISVPLAGQTASKSTTADGVGEARVFTAGCKGVWPCTCCGGAVHAGGEGIDYIHHYI